MTNVTSTATATDQRGYRLTSIDMLRGLVLVIMVLDHARSFVIMNAHNPMTDPNAPISLCLTRLITHICAPVFIFLAGTSAGLMTPRKSPAVLGGFLFKRGLWLIVAEVMIVSTFWNFSFFHFPSIRLKPPASSRSA